MSGDANQLNKIRYHYVIDFLYFYMHFLKGILHDNAKKVTSNVDRGLEKSKRKKCMKVKTLPIPSFRD